MSWDKVVQVCKELKMKKVLGLSSEDVEKFVSVWNEFLKTLSEEERNSLGIGTFKWGVILFKEVPQKVVEDREFLEFLIEVIAGGEE